MTKNYDSLDLTKFIASICVVALHADALRDFSPMANSMICWGLFRLAVPLFFVISAFFFFSKEVTWEGTKKYCKRLLILYAAWFIVSIPKTIFDRFICSPYPIGETVFRFIRSFFVTSTFSGSWFIVSCIFSALVYYKLEKLPERTRKGITVGISVIVYLWVTFSSAYGKLMTPLGMDDFYSKYTLLFANPYCSFLVGIPYFALGRRFAKREMNGSPRKYKEMVKWGGACLLLLLLEVYLTIRFKLQKSSDCYLMLLPCVFCMFPLLVNRKVKVKNAKYLRIASTIVFFSQFLFLFVCEFAEWALKITIPCLGKFAFTVAMGLLLTWIILKLKDKKNFRWLRYFY